MVQEKEKKRPPMKKAKEEREEEEYDPEVGSLSTAKCIYTKKAMQNVII